MFLKVNCRTDGTMKKSLSTRALRSNNSTEDETAAVISRPVAQLIDEMSNFFLPKKDQMNNIERQQSVQKAMKYLINKTIKPWNTKVLQRLNTVPMTTNKNENDKNQLLARSILASSKTPRIGRKPVNLTNDSPSE